MHQTQQQHYIIKPGLYYSFQLARASPASSPINELKHNNNINDRLKSNNAINNNFQINDEINKAKARRLSYLPYPLPFSHKLKTPVEPPVSFDWLTESCGGKAAIGIFGGGVMGLLMGVFLGAMSDMTPPVTAIAGFEVPTAPLKEQMRTTMRATAEKSMYWCRQFAFITGVFSGSECLVEKYRGKHDMWNPVLSGCVTGAAMQAKQGPQAAAMGCGGFAVFSLLIEQVMPH